MRITLIAAALVAMTGTAGAKCPDEGTICLPPEPGCPK